MWSMDSSTENSRDERDDKLTKSSGHCSPQKLVILETASKIHSDHF